MFPTKNSLSADVREKSCGLLNQSLANLTDLIYQFRHAHWNVKGRLFFQHHKLFEEIGDMLEENLDELAERLTALGGIAGGTIRRAAAKSSLPELSLEGADGEKFITALIESTSQFGGIVRKGLDESDEAGDKGTADFLTKLVQDADKALWLLESHVRH